MAAVLVLLFSFARPIAANAADRAADQREIRAAAQEYVSALEKGDGDALRRYWTADGDFVDVAGESHPASELVAEAARAAAAGQRPSIKLLTSQIRFLADDVALEDGTSEVTWSGPSASTGAGRKSTRGRFSAVWVKQDGKWRLASLREARIGAPAAPERLADLAWMLGRWSAQSGDTTVETGARWNVSETFLLRDLKVTREGKVVFRAEQRIGWDPITHKIKSWNFDSDGGYGEGMWSREGDSWVVQSSSVHPDGRQTSSTAVVTYDGKDDFTWTSSGPRGGGEPAAALELQFKRQAAKRDF
jgi:uncharacterized protein (TIGR02246 family)